MFSIEIYFDGISSSVIETAILVEIEIETIQKYLKKSYIVFHNKYLIEEIVILICNHVMNTN